MSDGNSTPVVKTFQYCPSCGATQSNGGQNPFRCESCEYVMYFSPAAAVGAIIRDSQGNIMFLVRGRDPGKGKLGLPGGFADAGETLETSLRREVLEESSLVVEEIQYLCSFPNQYDYRGVTVEVLDTFFVCSVESFDSLTAQAGEVEGFRFEKPTQATLEKMAFASNRKAIECFIKKCS
ncbi:NUDIX domain-containing protein [Mariniblastus sp.]|nr:NUDIX domain-containing protein [Mariniblastus sp.]